jgi:hypothetical protein
MQRRDLLKHSIVFAAAASLSVGSTHKAAFAVPSPNQKSRGINLSGYRSSTAGSVDDDGMQFDVVFSKMTDDENNVFVSLSKLIFNVDQDQSRASFCSIAIFGLSDFDDRPGLSHAERVKSERRASLERADRFGNWLRDQVNDLRAGLGIQAGINWDALDRVFVRSEGLGASTATAATDEIGRRRNRGLLVVIQSIDMEILPFSTVFDCDVSQR